jgi:hypothetical protein
VWQASLKRATEVQAEVVIEREERKVVAVRLG